MLKILNNRLKYRIAKTRNLFLAGLLSLSSGLLNGEKSIVQISSKGKATATTNNTYTMSQSLGRNKDMSINAFLEVAKHYVDTTVVNKYNYNSSLCLGRYLPKIDRVYMKHFVADTTETDSIQKYGILDFVKKYNNKNTLYSSLAHEFKHQDNHRNKFQKFDVCPQDFARLCQHNEISAQITSLLYQRELYIKTKDLSVFEPRFKKYREAINKGIITPCKDDSFKKEFEKRYIVKTVSDWWVKSLQKKYEAVTLLYLRDWLNDSKIKPEESKPQEYQKALDVCYSFIMDGKLTNLNYFNNSRLKDVNLTTKMATTIDKYNLKVEPVRDTVKTISKPFYMKENFYNASILDFAKSNKRSY